MVEGDSILLGIPKWVLDSMYSEVKKTWRIGLFRVSWRQRTVGVGLERDGNADREHEREKSGGGGGVQILRISVSSENLVVSKKAGKIGGGGQR